MMRRVGLWMGLAATLSSCGGSGGSNSGSIAVVPGATPTPSPTATPTPTATAGCTVATRQAWVDARMREWYLFPETLPTSINASAYTTVQAYIDALTATARSQRRDRFFTYITSIAEETAYYSSGQTAGFGMRLSYPGGGEVIVSEAFEGAPALAAGIDRGTRITGIGTTTANIRSVSDIVAAEGSAGITAALGPNTAGTTRVLRFTTAGVTREASVAKTDFELTPVSSRYGYRIIDDGGRKVGYVNLRTFISTANQQLRDAFAAFRAQGITQVVVDLRYNGGGLVATADLFSNLLGGGRSGSDVLSYTTFRAERSSNNETDYFAPQPQSIAATKIAFIGTGGTASASELVINSMLPYLRANAGLVGTNTYGKPVGQIALDNANCDDRLRVVAFATQNANRQGAYFDGLATTMEATCRAGDDIAYPLGDPREASVAAALTYLRGGSCTPITASAAREAGSLAAPRELLSPEQPTTAQREVPGLF